MSEIEPNKSGRRCIFGGYGWPLAIVTGLGITVAVNISFLILSLSPRVYLVDENPYEEGLAYDSVMIDEKWLADKGWKITGALSTVTEILAQKVSPEKRLVITINGTAPNQIESVNAHITSLQTDSIALEVPLLRCRPTTQDRISLTSESYCTEKSIPQGLWRAIVTITSNGRSIRSRLVVS